MYKKFDENHAWRLQKLSPVFLMFVVACGNPNSIDKDLLWDEKFPEMTWEEALAKNKASASSSEGSSQDALPTSTVDSERQHPLYSAIDIEFFLGPKFSSQRSSARICLQGNFFFEKGSIIATGNQEISVNLSKSGPCEYVFLILILPSQENFPKTISIHSHQPSSQHYLESLSKIKVNLQVTKGAKYCQEGMTYLASNPSIAKINRFSSKCL